MYHLTVGSRNVTSRETGISVEVYLPVILLQSTGMGGMLQEFRKQFRPRLCNSDEHTLLIYKS